MPSPKGFPRFDITVNGQKLTDLGYHAHVRSISLRLSEGRLPILNIRLANPEDRLTADEVFVDDALIGLKLGYGSQLARMGSFFLSMPRTMMAGLPNELNLECFGEAVRATRLEQRRQFENITIAGVAKRIAREEGWTPAVVETATIYDSLTQLQESNFKFLNRLARPIGFILEVVNGVMYFGPRRTLDTGVVAGRGAAGGGLGVEQFQMTTENLKAASNISAAGFDRMSKEQVVADSAKLTAEGPMRIIESLAKRGSVSAEDVVWGTTDRATIPRAYLEPGWAVQGSAVEAEEVVRGQWRMRRWPFEARATLSGDPSIIPGAVIQLTNLGAYGGPWFVHKALHRLFEKDNGSAYSADVELLSIIRGPLTKGVPFDDTAGSSEKSDVADLRPVAEGGRLAGTFEVG